MLSILSAALSDSRMLGVLYTELNVVAVIILLLISVWSSCRVLVRS